MAVSENRILDPIWENIRVFVNEHFRAIIISFIRYILQIFTVLTILIYILISISVFSRVLLFFRWETIPMPVARVRMAIRTFGRTNASLPKTHGSQTIQMRRLRTIIRQIRSFGVAHEAPPTEDDQVNKHVNLLNDYFIYITSH